MARLDPTILDKVFEWCDENKDFFVRQSADFFLKRRFDNQYEPLQLTAWQRDFFKRNRAHLWLSEEMRRHSAEELAATFAGSDALTKEPIPMPDDIQDDIIGDVLRFTDHVDLARWKRIGSRWKRVIDENRRFLPLRTVNAEVEGIALNPVQGRT
ncbi:hypothetical protein AAVH_10313 [Aphelenchoides avenae]|nr:hypothetical protein AAVH_10313 [Aphelenchus avenae]